MGAIGFRKAKCKDCYKCVRLCPVKGDYYPGGSCQVRGQRVCFCADVAWSPVLMNAITVFSDIDRVKTYIDSGEKVIASLSPAYLGIYSDIEPGQLIEGLFTSLVLIRFGNRQRSDLCDQCLRAVDGGRPDG